MYSHLLVPIDGTALSAANVHAAIRLAGALGARITFFHATADYAATDDGALMHTLDPKMFADMAIGETNALLLKAAASARIAGVPCDAIHRTSDRPAEAIVKAAQEQGADLIVMASRGARGIAGWLHSSQTERVLRAAPVAMLVTRVEAIEPLNASERALGIILDEHRSIAVVMQSLRSLAESKGELGAQEARQIEMLVGYLRDFPQRLHHPKEELHLHSRLRSRGVQHEELLAALESQHKGEAVLLGRVTAAVRQFEQDGAQAEKLREAVRALVTALANHMRLEEASLFPLACKELTPQDWADIATAFDAHDDPQFGDLPTAEFERLFKRIADLTVRREQVVA